MNNSYITIIKEKRTALSRKRIPLNQNGCTANFRIGVPFEQNLHKDGGGLFLIIYFMLVLTFGFTLLTSDIAIGRRTQKSAIGAYAEMKPKWKFLGILTFLVPVLIMTYYAVIGGWITKYAVVYLTGQAKAAAADDYFTSLPCACRSAW